MDYFCNLHLNLPFSFPGVYSPKLSFWNAAGRAIHMPFLVITHCSKISKFLSDLIRPLECTSPFLYSLSSCFLGIQNFLLCLEFLEKITVFFHVSMLFIYCSFPSHMPRRLVAYGQESLAILIHPQITTVSLSWAVFLTTSVYWEPSMCLALCRRPVMPVNKTAWFAVRTCLTV